jgi:hypothetical protein
MMETRAQFSVDRHPNGLNELRAAYAALRLVRGPSRRSLLVATGRRRAVAASNAKGPYECWFNAEAQVLPRPIFKDVYAA